MPIRKYDAVIVWTGTDCSVHYINESFVYRDLKDAFKDQEKVTVEIKSRRKPRNLDQNAYLHLCLQMIADETGNSLDQVKTTLKAMYAKKPLLDKNDEPIMNPETGEAAFYIQDTRDMSTVECFTFTENVRMFASDFCNLILPEPQQQIDLKLK